MQVSVLVGSASARRPQDRPVHGSHDAVLAGVGVPPGGKLAGGRGRQRDTKGPTGGSLCLRNQGELPAGRST